MRLAQMFEITVVAAAMAYAATVVEEAGIVETIHTGGIVIAAIALVALAAIVARYAYLEVRRIWRMRKLRAQMERTVNISEWWGKQ